MSETTSSRRSVSPSQDRARYASRSEGSRRRLTSRSSFTRCQRSESIGGTPPLKLAPEPRFDAVPIALGSRDGHLKHFGVGGARDLSHATPAELGGDAVMGNWEARAHRAGIVPSSRRARGPAEERTTRQIAE